MDPLKPERSSTWDSGYDTVADETRRHRHYRSSGVFNVFSAPAPLIVEPEMGNPAGVPEGSKPSSIAASVNTNIAPRSSQAQAIPLRDVDKRMIFPCPLAPNKWFHIKFRCNAGIQGEIHRPFDYDLYHECLIPNAAVIHLGRPCTCIRADTPLPETTSIKTSTSSRLKIDMTAESTVIKGQTKAEVSMRSGDAFLSTMMGGIELEPKKQKEKKEKPKDSAKRRGYFLSKLIR